MLSFACFPERETLKTLQTAEAEQPHYAPSASAFKAPPVAHPTARARARPLQPSVLFPLPPYRATKGRKNEHCPGILLALGERERERRGGKKNPNSLKHDLNTQVRQQRYCRCAGWRGGCLFTRGGGGAPGVARTRGTLAFVARRGGPAAGTTWPSVPRCADQWG